MRGGGARIGDGAADRPQAPGRPTPPDPGRGSAGPGDRAASPPPRWPPPNVRLGSIGTPIPRPGASHVGPRPDAPGRLAIDRSDAHPDAPGGHGPGPRFAPDPGPDGT